MKHYHHPFLKGIEAIEELSSEYLYFHFKPENGFMDEDYYQIYFEGINFELELEREKENVIINSKYVFHSPKEIKNHIINFAKEKRKKERIEILFNENNYFFKYGIPTKDNEVLESIYRTLKKSYKANVIEEYCAKEIKNKKSNFNGLHKRIDNIKVTYIKKLDHYFLFIEDNIKPEIFHFKPEEKELGIQKFKEVCKELFIKQLEIETSEKLEKLQNF
jgi:hypothetical protein